MFTLDSILSAVSRCAELITIAITGLICAVVLPGCDTTPPAPIRATESSPTRQPPQVTTSDLKYQAPSSANYLGGDACTTCHSDIADSFASHPMSKSIRFADEVTLQDDHDRRVDGENRFLTVRYDDDGTMHHAETMVDAAGKTIFDQQFAMDFVVGSGQRAYAYLRQEGNLLFQSPLNWYSKDGKWDLSPGYHKDDPRRFRRRMTDDCLACHAGRINSHGRSLNRYERPAFHQMSISCENCHGPGREHVAFHDGSNDATNDANTNSTISNDPIVNPVKLPTNERESVCNQCHLEATARILRPGRSHFDFRPGQTLEEIWTVLDAGVDVTQGGRGRAVNHVQQMRSSGCYVGTQGELGCTSCHDPHRSPSAKQRVSFYRSRCLTCHDTQSCSAPSQRQSEQDDSCIACHMPYRESNNISHVTQTDHRVLRQPVEETDEESSEVQLLFFDDANKRLADWESKRATGFGVWQYLDRKGQPKPANLSDYLQPVLKTMPNDGVTLALLGMLAAERGQHQAAIGHYEKARQTPTAEETAVSGLLTLYYLKSQWKLALPCADRMIQIDPGDARYHAMRADILGQLGQLDEGVISAQRAIALNPTLIPVRQWLVNALKRLDRLADATAAQILLDRMQTAIKAGQ